jgi:hypothetical protein
MRWQERRVLGESAWANPRSLRTLRKIDRRHGILPKDSRVYSINAYKRERAKINIDFHRAAPVSKEEWQRSIRHASRLADCEARHFPGMFFGAKHWGLWVKHRAGSWKLIKLIEAAHGTRENVIRSHRGAALHQF